MPEAPSQTQQADYPLGADNGQEIWEDTGPTAFLQAQFNQNVTASTVVIAGVAGKKIRVLGAVITGVTADGVTFQTQTGPAGIAGPFYMGANGQVVLPFSKAGWFETLAGDGLFAILTGATVCGGTIIYVLH